MTRVVVIDSGVANLASIRQALLALGADVFVTTSVEELDGATHVVLPGVGAFANVGRLVDLGFANALRAWHGERRPLLAICLGMQMLCEGSDEAPGVSGLSILPARCERLPDSENVPHLGWNHVRAPGDARYLGGGMAAFANSYALYEALPGWRAAWTTHGVPFVAALERDRTVACQFHPEISGAWGIGLIERWLMDHPVTAAPPPEGERRVTSRIVPCLDVLDGAVVKGVRFQSLRDLGDPAAHAARYETEGADEIVVLDVAASAEGRDTQVRTIANVRSRIRIPLTAGGGVRTAADARRLLAAGADKVSVNTAAVRRPELVDELADAFGSQCVVLAVDARRREGGWDVLTHGGRESSGREAIEWIVEGSDRGAGEVLLTSWDRDGTRDGYDLDLLEAARTAVRISIIASGGVGRKGHLLDALEAGADAVLAASIFHDREETVRGVKEFLSERGCTVRT